MFDLNSNDQGLEHRERIVGLSRSYRGIFLDDKGGLTSEALKVLDDLADFTFFHKTAATDFESLAVAEGRRQVMRHLFDMLNLNKTARLSLIKKGVYGHE